jgi:hypothetical protein
MKKFILSTVTLVVTFLYLLSPFPAPTLTRAQADVYACVLTDDAYFYSSKDVRRGLFVLPQTYYVRILKEEGEFCKIEYQTDDEYTRKLIGYAKTDTLTPVPYVPEQPFFYKVFDTTYTLDGSVGGEGFLDEIRLTCAYYGDYVVGTATYCYVLRGGDFGYVPKPETLTVPRNTEYEEWLAVNTPTPPVSESTDKKENASPAQIAVIVGLCLLVPILSALLLRSGKNTLYDED